MGYGCVDWRVGIQGFFVIMSMIVFMILQIVPEMTCFCLDMGDKFVTFGDIWQKGFVSEF